MPKPANKRSRVKPAPVPERPPRPDRLPVPDMTKLDEAFPTLGKLPPLDWVPDRFWVDPKADRRYENRNDPWVELAHTFFAGRPPATQWHAIPREGVNAEKAWVAVVVALRCYGLRHEEKMAQVAYMLSEWFEDFWWDGDAALRIAGTAPAI